MADLLADLRDGRAPALAAIGRSARDVQELAAGAGAWLAEGQWDRARLVALLRDICRSRPQPAKALAAAEALADPACVCVLSGQQPALGLGPLYNLVKIAHSIKLCRALRAEGRPAVPVFWCASEDHDLTEAGHCDLLRRDGRLQRLTHRFARPGLSLRRQPAAAAVAAVYAALQALAPHGLGRAWWLERLPSANDDFGRWTADRFAELFADDGLIVIEAAQLRRLWSELWPRLAQRWPVAALQAQARELAAQGYATPLGEMSTPPVFADLADGRRAISDWRDLDPDDLSPGAGLRPVLQQLALPCLAYCAGPGEIAYHAQLGPVYAALQAPRPYLLPRRHVLLQPAWHARACAAWDTDAWTLLAGQLPEPLASDQPATLARLAEAIEQLQASQATAQPRIAAAQVRLRRELERLRQSLQRDRRQTAGRLSPQLLQAWLRPRERAQERVLTTLQSLWEHGPGLIPALQAGLAQQTEDPVLLQL